ATVSTPACTPIAVGEKLTVIEQLDPAARVCGVTGQVLVWWKSPVVVMDEMVSGAKVVERLAVWVRPVVPTATVPNVSGNAKAPHANPGWPGSWRLAQGVAAVVPVPLREMLCGPAAVLSPMLRLPCNGPV